MVGLVDSHAHLTSAALEKNLTDIIKKAKAYNVSNIITVGTDPDDSQKAVNIAKNSKGIFAAVGIHPHNADQFNNAHSLKKLTQEDKVIAIGETGLDYYYNFSSPENQRKLFESQIELATESDLPLIIHTRQAFDDTLSMLKECKHKLRCVFHCFTEDKKAAQKIIDNGWFISLTGIITFKNSRELQNTIKDIGPENLLLETDSPYLSPEPVRKMRPNEPSSVKYIAEFLATLFNMSIDKIAEITYQNAIKLFGRIDKEKIE